MNKIKCRTSQQNFLDGKDKVENLLVGKDKVKNLSAKSFG